MYPINPIILCTADHENKELQLSKKSKNSRTLYNQLSEVFSRFSDEQILELCIKKTE